MVFVLIIFSLHGQTVQKKQTEQKNQYIKTWHLTSPFGIADSIPVDTVPLDFQDGNPIDRFSIANSYNGNIGSPIQSKLYFDRPAATDFIFSAAYFPYIMNLAHATFYNTKTPYSNLNYTTGGSTYRDEDNIKFLFTANANQKLNFGTTLDYIYSPGEYANQAVQRFSGSLFGSYNGKHYNATGLISTNNLSNYENGGLQNTANGINPFNISPKDLPVNITGYSNYKYNLLLYNHQYTIGFERPIRINPDSVRMEYVPVTRFTHTFKLEDIHKRYYENSLEKSFYANTYGTAAFTNDTAALQTMTNNFSISMDEEFNKLMKFGLTAFIENEIQRYGYTQDSLFTSTLKSNTKVGGVLSKQRGQRFKYNILGEITLLGFKTGDFQFKGNVEGNFKLWKDSISLVANGFVRSDQPSLFLQQYESNHFKWINNFNKTYRTSVGGTFAIPTRLLRLNISIENITQLIYFDDKALPKQYSGNVQVLAGNLRKDFVFGKFGLENNVVYQISSQPGILPLPSWALYNNLYFKDLWFKVLTVQLGVNLRYQSSYFAPAYMPATGQFYNQSNTLIGNYPMMNAYANFHLKQTRFFVQYYHVNQLFMKGNYYSMPGYPLNPAIFEMGLSWNFYN